MRNTAFFGEYGDLAYIRSRSEKKVEKMALKLVAKTEIPDVGEISVWSDIRLLTKGVNRLNRKGVPRAITRATNKALLKTRTQTRRQLAKKFNLPAKEVNKTVTHRNASLNNGTAYIQGRGSQIPIIKVKGSVTQKRLGVALNTGTGRRVIPHSFIATMASGHTGVYKRVGRKAGKRVRYIDSMGRRQTSALPIRELKFPSPAHMITNKKFANGIFQFFTQDYPTQLKRQLNYEWDKARGLS